MTASIKHLAHMSFGNPNTPLDIAGIAMLGKPSTPASSSELFTADLSWVISSCPPLCQTGPTAWIIFSKGKEPAIVGIAMPIATSWPGYLASIMSDSCWITDPPFATMWAARVPVCHRRELAGLTIALLVSFIRSPWRTLRVIRPFISLAFLSVLT